MEEGFKTAARFLRQLNIFRVADLPYQTQVVPLAAILHSRPQMGECDGQSQTVALVLVRRVRRAVRLGGRKPLRQGRAGGAAWIEGGPEPTTVRDGVFRADRLRTMRTRLSAAYKGIHALLMQEGARTSAPVRRSTQSVLR